MKEFANDNNRIASMGFEKLEAREMSLVRGGKKKSRDIIG